jgi:hypothetical protein
MFVLFNIKVVVIIPAIFYCKFESLDAVLNSALVKAFTLTCVTVRPEETGVRLQLGHSFLSSLLEDDNHEGSN